MMTTGEAFTRPLSSLHLHVNIYCRLLLNRSGQEEHGANNITGKPIKSCRQSRNNLGCNLTEGFVVFTLLANDVLSRVRMFSH